MIGKSDLKILKVVLIPKDSNLIQIGVKVLFDSSITLKNNE